MYSLTRLAEKYEGVCKISTKIC